MKTKPSDRNKVLTEAQRCINLAIATLEAETIDKNAIVLDLNAAYGLIQTVKGID